MPAGRFTAPPARADLCPCCSRSLSGGASPHSRDRIVVALETSLDDPPLIDHAREGEGQLWPLIGAAHGVSRVVRQALLRHRAPTGNGGAGFLEIERESEAHGHAVPLAGDGARLSV